MSFLYFCSFKHLLFNLIRIRDGFHIAELAFVSRKTCQEDPENSLIDAQNSF